LTEKLDKKSENEWKETNHTTWRI